MEIQMKMNLPVEPDATANYLDWLGSQLFAVKNGIDGKAYVIDAETGKILWDLDDCYVGVEGQCAGDEKAVYIARESKGKRFITAHKPETGEEIWNCYLSTGSDQFCSPLTQNEKYLFHTNTTQIFVVEKSTGKLVNKFKAAYADVERGKRIVLPWEDKVLYAGWIESGKGKSKKTSLALTLYDPLNKNNAFIEDIITINGRYTVEHIELLNENMLFLLSGDAVMRIIDLNTKQVCFEHDFVPNGDQTMDGYDQGYVSQIARDGDMFHFMVMATETEPNKDDEYISHKNFSTLDLKKKTLACFDDAGAYRYSHYYYDGNLVYTGLCTFKPDDTRNKESTGIDIKEVLLMEVIDSKFYLLQDNEDETVTIIVLKK